MDGQDVWSGCMGVGQSSTAVGEEVDGQDVWSGCMGVGQPSVASISYKKAKG